MLGWNGTAVCSGLGAIHLHSLAGEAIHLAPLSLMYACLFAHPTAPWWQGRQSADSELDVLVPGPSGSSSVPASAPKKRRTGGLRVCRSL